MSQIQKSIVLIVFLIFSSIVVVNALDPEVSLQDISWVFVSDVIDGDTFETSKGYRIRLADIDAPELGELGYLESTEYLTLLVENKMVILDVDDITGTDQYGRYVCLVFVEHNSTHFLNVNQALLEGGYAVVDNFSNNEFEPAEWSLYTDQFFPVAEFTYAPLSPLLMEPIWFDASSSYDTKGFVMSYWWDFGDGKSYSTINPIITHTYNFTNIYNVTLKVSNNLGINSSYFFHTISFPKIQPRISIETFCNTFRSATSFSELEVSASGRLIGEDGNGIKDAPVALLYKNENTSKYKFVESCFTGKNGWYSLGWIPPATGNFILKIEWAPWTGNPTYTGTSATAWVSTLTVEDQYSFLVGSNSSISNLFFNATDRKLSFNVESNIEIKSYARIVTTKSLLNNWGLNSRLYMDGNELYVNENEEQYCAPSIEDYAMGDFVQFEVNYDYGSHQIVLDHDITIVPEFPSEIILLIFTFVTLAAVVVKKKLK